MHDEVAENKVNFFKSIINNSFDIISVISTDWSIIFESNATTRILGYESGKRNGKNIFDFIHKDDKDYVLKKFEELTVAPSVSINIEFRYRHENSDWIWLESSGQNLLSNNEINGLLLNSRDITKKKKEEQKQLEIVELNNAIINSTQDCVKTLDIQGNLLTMNRAGQKLLEINDINRYLNKSWIEFWKDDDYINVRKAFQKAKNGNIGYFEGYCPTVLGKPKWWGIIISPMYNQKGQIHQLLSVSRDITSQKEQKDQLNERIKELKGIQQLSNLVVKYDSIEDILKNLVNVIQRSFLNPHNTSVKITYDEYSFHTPNYNPENITISKVIQVQGNNVCMINIGLTSGTEDDILEEEKTLINIISERLGHIIERIQHKKKYEYLFDTLLEAILEADSEGFIVEANKAAVELCGYTTPAEIKGTHMKELYAHPNTRNEILKKL